MHRVLVHDGLCDQKGSRLNSIYGGYLLTTVGGKVVRRSKNLGVLVPDAREILADGWRVFVKSQVNGDNNCIEFKLEPNMTVSAQPTLTADPEWVEAVLEGFQP